MHLYYFPIILLAYHYKKKGIIFSVILGLYYVLMVLYFQFQNAGEIIAAIERYFTFIGVALVIAYLSIHLEKRQSEIQSLSQFGESIISNAQVWLTVLDAAGTIHVWNKAAEDISGYTTKEVIGKNTIWRQLYPDKEYRNTITGTIVRIIKEKKYFENFVTTIQTKNGKNKTISWNTRAIPDERGILSHFVAIGIDITERKLAEQAQKESETRYRSVFENTGTAMVIVEEDTTISLANAEFMNLTGFTREEIEGKKSWTEFVVKEDLERMLAQHKLRRERQEEALKHYEFRLVTKSNLVKDILLTIDVIPGTKKSAASLMDITERKKAELQLKTFNVDLERGINERTASLHRTTELLQNEVIQHEMAEKRIQESLNEKNILLREIHHRVKNNLQIIASMLNLQSRYINDEKTLQAIRESQSRVKAMALVHEKLYRSLDISKIDLDDYVRFLGTNLFQFFDMKGRGVTFCTDIHGISVDINSAIPVGLMINELISNSLKYAFPDGRKGEISVAMHRQDHSITIIMKDNGIGIPEGFDWRNAPSLGLRLVISLVEQLSGTIELDRTEGTTFRIEVKEKG